ncbi:MAG: PEP-CTERM/exosortase system-associated acyltransferase [Gammaproteobacteria bacterium]|jgi:N-acyl amino acid synthase of PEP-CTERM/exosortase system|nr:PEP-CTERM/exosortase system-associated acyltransferase [Gammaproteobacteria bacterium]
MTEQTTEAEGSVAERFDRYFRVDLADRPDLLRRVYNVRYRVYCEEFGYEPLSRCPDAQERDEYDVHSVHCLITHRASGQAAGCVRMVPALGPMTASPLPFEKHCMDSLDHAFIDGLGLDRSTVCEISRLAVDRDFRRRAGEAATRFGRAESLNFGPEERRTLPFIAVAAYLAATAITDQTGRTNVFAMMEPFLPRLLGRAGIHFQRAGSDVDFRGIRAPYFITTQSALEHMEAELKELYECIRAQLYGSDAALRAAPALKTAAG